jgi:hypothetical protein
MQAFHQTSIMYGSTYKNHALFPDKLFQQNGSVISYPYVTGTGCPFYTSHSMKKYSLKNWWHSKAFLGIFILFQATLRN